MKRMALVLIVLMVGLCGCDTTSQQRLEGLQQFLGMAQQESRKIDGDIQLLQTTIDNLEASANEPGLPPAEVDRITSYLTSASEQLSRVIGTKEKVDKAITEAKAAIDKIEMGQADIGTELQAIGEVIKGAGASVPPPYGTYVGIFGTLIAGVGTLVAKRKNDALKVSGAAAKRERDNLQVVVKSVDVAKRTLNEDATRNFVQAMKGYQGKPDGPTRVAVDKIRA